MDLYDRESWGDVIHSKKETEYTVAKRLHISLAALINRDQELQLALHHQNCEVVLCSLNKTLPQQLLDLNFGVGEDVQFRIIGEGSIALSGYILPDPSDSSSDDDSEEKGTDCEDGQSRPISRKRKRVRFATETVSTNSNKIKMICLKNMRSIHINYNELEPVYTEGKGGIMVKDRLIGEGPLVKTGDKVLLHYASRVYGTNELLKCHSHENPFVFVVGPADGFSQWSDIIDGMKVGGRREIIVPPKKNIDRRNKEKRKIIVELKEIIKNIN